MRAARPPAGGRGTRRRGLVRLAAASLVFLAAAGCGGGATVPTSTSVQGSTAGTSPSPGSTVASSEGFAADPGGARYHPMHRLAFGPIYGSGCPVFGACGCGNAKTLSEELACQLDHLAANDIPIAAYLFDGSAWSAANSSADNQCSGPDCCSWKLGDEPLRRLAGSGTRGLLHFWGGCHQPEQYQRAATKLGRTLLGFYMDDGSSDDELRTASEFMQSVLPGDWECVAKAFQNRQPSTSSQGLEKWANAAYVGDLTFQFSGLEDAVDRVLAAAPLVPAPFAEFSGYAYQDTGSPPEEVYFRRLAFGALQPVMANTPYANSDPWRPEYSSSLLAAYRYYSWLHKELVPYFYSYAYAMHENPSAPVLKAGPMPHSMLVGQELYVPIVSEPTRSLTIELPEGQWIDYWDESRLVSGTLHDFAVPLGREPVFVRQGALVPMEVQRPYTGHGTRESASSLTMLVYPAGMSSFRYREGPAQPWVTFTSALGAEEGTDPSAEQLTLQADPAPGRPVLYRVGRWSVRPASVDVQGARVIINQGGSLPELSSETAVNGSAHSAWFYDAAARRLVVKVAP